MLQLKKVLSGQVAPVVLWSLWKAKCDQMFQGQIVSVEETMASTW